MSSPKIPGDAVAPPSTEKAKISSLGLLAEYDSSSESSDEIDENNHNIEGVNNSSETNDEPIIQSTGAEQQLNNQEIGKNMESCDSEMVLDEGNCTVSDAQPMETQEDLVLKNNMINANHHGPLPDRVTLENTDNTRIEEDQMNDGVVFEIKEVARSAISDSDSDSSSDVDSDSSSEWESLKGAEHDSDSDEPGEAKAPSAGAPHNKVVPVKAKGELGLDDLPPIQDLAISVQQQDCLLVGNIYEIVDQLVIVQSLPNKPALDLDTVLFLEEGTRTLGQVFDVFGQVVEPFYCVRFNSKDHINEKKIEIGMFVYCAPKSEHTKLVFVSDLMRIKGTDASWKDDIETPSQFLEYSDDEEERKAKREQKKKFTVTKVSEPQASPSEQKRYKPTQFEERMNRKNLEKTAECNRNNTFHPPNYFRKNTNPFSRRNNNFNPPRNDSSEIQWGAPAWGNSFDTPQHMHLMNAHLGGFPPNMCAPPPFMRAPRFPVPMPAAPPLWFAAPPPPPPSGPPGT